MQGSKSNAIAATDATSSGQCDWQGAQYRGGLGGRLFISSKVILRVVHARYKVSRRKRTYVGELGFFLCVPVGYKSVVTARMVVRSETPYKTLPADGTLMRFRKSRSHYSNEHVGRSPDHFSNDNGMTFPYLGG